MFDVNSQHTRHGTPSGFRRRLLAQQRSYEGKKLGEFHISHEIAAGGMGRVFLAHRMQHGSVAQPVAVKLIHPHLACEDEFVSMFRDEATIASSLSHANLCRALDFGKADDTYYFAMEYVMGESLSDVLTRLRSSPDTEWLVEPFIKYATYQVCEALHAAHEAQDGEGKPLGIVHRDISPQNILIGYDGCVKLLDFGVARAAQRLHATRAGVVKGRLSYMAPEQMLATEVDARADLWSVGVVLWEGLTGRRLFNRRSEVQTILAVTADPIPLATHPTRPIPIDLQRVIARALERDPSERHATARELGREILRSKSVHPQTGMADVSEWMKFLFPNELARKRASLRESALAAQAAEAAKHPPVVALHAVDDDEDAVTRVTIPIPVDLPRTVPLTVAANSQQAVEQHAKDSTAPLASEEPRVIPLPVRTPVQRGVHLGAKHSKAPKTSAARQVIPLPVATPARRTTEQRAKPAAAPKPVEAPRHTPSKPATWEVWPHVRAVALALALLLCALAPHTYLSPAAVLHMVTAVSTGLMDASGMLARIPHNPPELSVVELRESSASSHSSTPTRELSTPGGHTQVSIHEHVSDVELQGESKPTLFPAGQEPSSDTTVAGVPTLKREPEPAGTSDGPRS